MTELRIKVEPELAQEFQKISHAVFQGDDSRAFQQAIQLLRLFQDGDHFERFWEIADRIRKQVQKAGGLSAREIAPIPAPASRHRQSRYQPEACLLSYRGDTQNEYERPRILPARESAPHERCPPQTRCRPILRPAAGKSCGTWFPIQGWLMHRIAANPDRASSGAVIRSIHKTTARLLKTNSLAYCDLLKR